MLKNVQNMVIRSADDFVTNLDSVDQKSNYFRDVRGIRNLGVGFIAQRDFGTIHRIATANYPACVVAGTATIHREFAFHDNQTGLDHEILVCIDTTNSRVRIFVDTSGYDTGTWYELTRVINAVVNATPSTTTKVVVLKTVTENGTALTLAQDDLIGYIVYNVTRQNSAYVTDSETTPSMEGDNYFGSDGLAWQANDVLIFFRTAGHFKAYLENSQAFTTTLLGITPHFEFNPISGTRKVNVYYGSSNDTPSMRNPVQIMIRPAKNFFGTTGGTYLATVPARWDMEALGGGLIPSYLEIGTLASQLVKATGAVTKNIVDQNSNDIIGTITAQVTENGTSSGDPVTINVYITVVYSDYEESDPILKIYSKINGTTLGGYLGIIPKINFSKLGKEITALRLYGQSSTWAEVQSGAYVTNNVDSNYKLFQEVRIGEQSAFDTTTYNVNDVTIDSWGNNHYVAGDILTLVGGTGDATVKVVSDPPGFDLLLLAHGTSGYTVQTYATTGGTGTGATVKVTRVSGSNTTPLDIWNLDSISQFLFVLDSAGIQIDFAALLFGNIALGNRSIKDVLQHQISTSRSIKKPRFGVTTTRAENPMSVIDLDDKTLGYSIVDGYGVVEDDNFAEAGADSTGALLRANLLDSLPIKKIISQNSLVHVFHEDSREVVDPQSGFQTLRECDFTAPRSVLSSPDGLVWCGYGNIYFVPIGDMTEIPINMSWENLYNGTLKIDDGVTPYITDDYRSAIISGYDQTFGEFWFHCQVNKHDSGSEYLCFRYSPDNKRWTVRQLNIGASYSPIVGFSQRSDGTTTITYATGVLRYPYMEGQYQYTDDIPSTGASTGKGIPTTFKMVVGEIADKINQNVLYNILPDYKGSSISGTGRLQVNLYANKETTPYDTQYFPVDVKEDEIRLLEDRDNISELAVEVLIPSADLADVKELDVSSIYLGLLKKIRTGNL